MKWLFVIKPRIQSSESSEQMVNYLSNLQPDSQEEDGQGTIQSTTEQRYSRNGSSSGYETGAGSGCWSQGPMGAGGGGAGCWSWGARGPGGGSGSQSQESSCSFLCRAYNLLDGGPFINLQTLQWRSNSSVLQPEKSNCWQYCLFLWQFWQTGIRYMGGSLDILFMNVGASQLESNAFRKKFFAWVGLKKSFEFGCLVEQQHYMGIFEVCSLSVVRLSISIKTSTIKSFEGVIFDFQRD